MPSSPRFGSMSERLPRPDSPAVADGAARTRSAYVHIPFCHRHCPYCDFAVVAVGAAGGPELIERYEAALLAEIAMEPEWGPLDAVNFGGGTPSLVPVSMLERVLAALADRFGIAPGAEVSIEANPEDWARDHAERLESIGFNRVSLGVQSFDDEVLSYLGRRHDGRTAEAAVAIARGTMSSVNLDLIFGSPGESLDSWAATLDTALRLGTHHLSCYALSVERGTDLSRRVATGAPAPDPDDQADKYELVEAGATAVGLVRYEVSNWARAGHACRYNLGTWAQGEYVGLGLGAHGFRGGVRRRNVRRLDAYLERVSQGMRPEAGSATATAWAAELERLFLGLRRTAGVALGPGVGAFLASPAGVVMMDAGVVEVVADRLVVRRPLLTDAVLREVLDVPVPTGW